MTARAALKIIGQVKSWRNISSCGQQINPNEKPHHCTHCSPNERRTPPHLFHQHAKQQWQSCGTPVLRGWGKVPFSNVTLAKPFLRSKKRTKKRRDNEIWSVTAGLLGGYFFLIKDPTIMSTSLWLIHLRPSAWKCWCAESSRSLPNAVLCRSSLIDPIRQVRRAMLGAC